ncbi:hypothetical protein A2246_06700 [candidate division WOR-1 bacterium RIFOXYA2_FULL_37_7]|nr:MAG: hypothetical protein A2246_06700 [candidate division WOR-1 bacterium RIFOXYA2_FULL_37_7]
MRRGLLCRASKFILFFWMFSLSFFIVSVFAYALSDDALDTEKYFDKNIGKYVDVVRGEILVKFKNAVSINSINTFNKQNNLKLVKTLVTHDKVHVLSVLDETKKVSVAELIETYKDNPSVEYVEPNFVMHALATTPNDFYYPIQWGLPLIAANVGWDISKGSAEAIIAVVDTGVELSHEDLSDKIWHNPIESAGTNSSNNKDDDGNGFVDDWQGWDFVQNDNNPSDLNGHGSHVSGIAASKTNNGKGVAGVSWNSRIMAVRVLNKFGDASAGKLSEGISYAVDNGAKVINLSLGAYSPSTAINNEVQNAYNQGCIVVAAAGNDGDSTLNYPAAYEHVIGVASIDRNNTRSDFSNSNNFVDVCAPGGYGSGDEEDIVSCYLDNSYVYMSGTSMSTPFVSGLAALLFSQNPSWSNDQVVTRIIGTADDLGSAGWDAFYGYGKINVYNALGGTLESNPVLISYVRAYPNPFKIGTDSLLVFDNLLGDEKINIYTISGDLVMSHTLNGDSIWNWDTKNSFGTQVARGIYMYLVLSSTGAKKIGKIAIIN